MKNLEPKKIKKNNEFVIDGATYTVAPITLGKALKLSKLISGCVTDLRMNINDIQKNGAVTMQDIPITALLGSYTTVMSDLISIVLVDSEGKEVTKEQVDNFTDIDNAIEVIDYIIVNSNLKELLKKSASLLNLSM